MNSPNNLQLACLFIGSPIALLLTLMIYRAYLNKQEIKRLEQNGHKRLYFPRPSDHGHACTEFLRAIAEGCCLILLLASVLGYWFYSGH